MHVLPELRLSLLYCFGTVRYSSALFRYRSSRSRFHRPMYTNQRMHIKVMMDVGKKSRSQPSISPTLYQPKWVKGKSTLIRSSQATPTRAQDISSLGESLSAFQPLAFSTSLPHRLSPTVHRPPACPFPPSLPLSGPVLAALPLRLVANPSGEAALRADSSEPRQSEAHAREKGITSEYHQIRRLGPGSGS